MKVQTAIAAIRFIRSNERIFIPPVGRISQFLTLLAVWKQSRDPPQSNGSAHRRSQCRADRQGRTRSVCAHRTSPLVARGLASEPLAPAIAPNPDHQRVPDDTTAHVTTDHEAQGPHHLLFPQIAHVRQAVSDAGGKVFIVGHGASQPFSAEIIS